MQGKREIRGKYNINPQDSNKTFYRRRKMIVDQAKAQRDIEIKKREEILLEKLQQQSKQVA